MDKEKGPLAAKAWAFNLGFDKEGLRELRSYIKNEFQKRGFNST